MNELQIRTCPVCGKSYSERPALSRRDNKTEICPACGMGEALEDYYKESLKIFMEESSPRRRKGGKQ